MADTYSKKQLQQKRAKKKQDKLERREDRKSNNDKGKSLEDMIVYLDENGNFTDVPPENQKKSNPKTTEIQLGAAPRNEEEEVCEGTVALFFHDKGYGFITDDKLRENVFVHVESLKQPIKEKDRVKYKIKKTPRGLTAIEVQIN